MINPRTTSSAWALKAAIAILTPLLSTTLWMRGSAIAQPATVTLENSGCRDGETTFVLAETNRFFVSICGQSTPNRYVGVAKSTQSAAARPAQQLSLPLATASATNFTARNGAYLYRLSLSDRQLVIRLPDNRQVTDPIQSLRVVAVSPRSQPFAPIRAALAGQTQLPVRLPTQIPNNPIDGQTRMWAIAIGTPNFYEVNLAYIPNCNGANVCNHFSFRAINRAGLALQVQQARQFGDTGASVESILREEYQTGERVTLANGSTAYFQSLPSGASGGGNQYLSWSQNGVFYQLVTRAYPSLPRALLIQSANSALQ